MGMDGMNEWGGGDEVNARGCKSARLKLKDDIRNETKQTEISPRR